MRLLLDFFFYSFIYNFFIFNFIYIFLCLWHHLRLVFLCVQELLCKSLWWSKHSSDINIVLVFFFSIMFRCVSCVFTTRWQCFSLWLWSQLSKFLAYRVQFVWQYLSVCQTKSIRLVGAAGYFSFFSEMRLCWVGPDTLCVSICIRFYMSIAILLIVMTDNDMQYLLTLDWRFCGVSVMYLSGAFLST